MEKERWKNIPGYSLENEKLKVFLCPSQGNNLYRIWDKVRKREVLRVPSDSEPFLEPPYRYGTPVLMPPGVIKDGFFRYGGKEYQFDRNTPEGHHIHGLVREIPWNVISVDEHSITSSFLTSDFPEVIRQYPHSLYIKMTYTLQGTSLLQIVEATNKGKSPAPFGFGLHTWFSLDHEPEKWTLQIPASEIWETDQEGIPTGNRLPLNDQKRLREGMNLRGVNMDTVFQIGNRPGTAVLSKKGYEIHYSPSDMYKQWVVFTRGPADEFICIEPYTWVSNAPNLNVDPKISGLRVVRPGETLNLEVNLTIKHGENQI